MGVCAPRERELVKPLKGKLLPQSSITKTSRLDSITEQYDFIRVIGYGQFGTVREATKIDRLNTETSNPKHYAIKSISKSRVRDHLELLQNELSILQLVDHPNIIKLYEIYEDSLYIHLVTELCIGGDLYEYLLEKESLNELEVAKIMMKIFTAVNHLHTMRICHRDIKPENVMFTDKSEDRELKLIDFGLSSKYRDELLESIVGTPYYLAPEVLKGSYSKECDVWSLGVMMYLLLSGKHPFKGSSMKNLFRHIYNCQYNFSEPTWSKISNQAKNLIQRMFTKNPNNRITISEALRHDWFTIVKSNAEPKISLEIFSSIKRNKAKSKLWQVAMKVLVRNLSSEQIDDLKNIFFEIDERKTGFVTAHDIEVCMNKNGYELAREEFIELTSKIEEIGRGRLNYTQFLIAALDRKKIFEEEILWEVFRVFDHDGNGFINLTDLKFALEKAGCYISDNEYQDIIEEFQLKYCQKLDYEEFKNIMGCFSEVQTAENSTLQSPNPTTRRTIRKLSNRKLTTRRASVIEAVKRVRRATDVPRAVKDSI
ncbi:unnamed protein product [Blepharisma stoltei]|uniref:non-specific serine/threonine protein kinase n=1 Tax=Blepharisma stoltei TaxID=1481888 RepID=A0AAU9JMY5_9CILI|nr:unnamed protein product [Blepharisma stoltei]